MDATATPAAMDGTTATVGRPLHVSVVLMEDAMASTITNVFEVLQSFEIYATIDSTIPSTRPFEVEIVGESLEPTATPSGLPLTAHRTLADVDRTDIVIVPSVMVEHGKWVTGRYPAIVEWLQEMHAGGAELCSTCSGVLILAETGLLDGSDATIHWAYEQTFKDNFPRVCLRVDDVLVATGDRGQFVMSGGSSSWNDLILYLVARHVGASATRSIAKFMLLDWHREGQAPYSVFRPVLEHDDAAIRSAQSWLDEHFAVAAPVDAMARQAGLADRTFKRRFKQATGYTPLSYVQFARIEKAKQLLETTEDAVEDVGWAVGYEDPSFFRRLFKRITGVSPGHYRKKFQLPRFVLQ